jgi:chemotaxis-related protein WspD
MSDHGLPGIAVESAVDAQCRNLIGVWGDQSCPELRRHVHCRNCEVYAQAGRQLLDRSAPSGYFTEWSAQTTDGASTQTSAHRSVMVFRVGSEWLALPTGLIREVIDPLPVRRVPHRNDPRFLGLVNVRGELLPCASLGALLGAPLAAHAGVRILPRMLVLERDGAAWTIPVDEVDGLRSPEEHELVAPPVTVALAVPAFTAAMFTRPVGNVGLLDDDLLWRALLEVCR